MILKKEIENHSQFWQLTVDNDVAGLGEAAPYDFMSL